MADEHYDRNDRKDRGGYRGRPSGGRYSGGGQKRDGDRTGGYRPKSDGRGARGDGGRRPRDDRPGDGPRGHGDGTRRRNGPYRGDRSGSGPGRDERGLREKKYRPRDDGRDGGSGRPRRDERPRDDRPRRDGRRDGGRRPRDDRPRDRGYGDGRRSGDRACRGPREGGRRDDRRPDRRRDVPAEHADRVTIPSDPQRILFKGIDCEVNGRSDLALVLYLHGAARMSGGCEGNAEKLLRGMGPEERQAARDSIAGMCSEDALIEFDYVRLQLDPAADRTLIDRASAEGSPLAVYCRIRLDEIEGDDPIIDAFAGCADERPEMVAKGLDRLRRRKDSGRAAEHLRRIEERAKARASINQTFARAMRNDAKALARLEDMSGEFPEAGFLAGYIESDDPEGYLREGMTGNRDLIVSVAANLNLDSGFGRYLRAMRAKSDGDDWIPLMVSAAKSGSEDAERELGSVKGRGDVSRAMAEIALGKGDAKTLVRMYDGEDARWLDAWCAGDPRRMIEAGSLMKEEEELDWLKRCYRAGSEECRAAIVSLASDPSRWSKRLVYALHDVGEDMEAARLYFSIGDSAALPSPKWLAKVCADEDVKAYVRSEYEKRGDLEGFEDIFAEDGYEKRHGGKGGRGRGNGPRGGRRR